MVELVQIHMLLNLRKIRESKMNWVAFYQIHVWIIIRCWETAHLTPPPPPLPPSIVSVKKKIVSAIHFWSRDWVLIGKSTSWAKLMRNLFCGNEFDLLGIEKKTFFIKGTCSRLNIEAYATHRGLAYWIKNNNKKQ